MPSLPESEIYLLVRTYFGDDSGWDALKATIDEGSEEGFFANVEYVDDRAFEGLSPEALETAHPHRVDGWDVMYLADEQAITHPVHPLLVVRVGSTEEMPFRCRADMLYEIDANLSLANLDWDEFRDEVDESGVYGGTAVRTAPEGVRPTDPAVAAFHAASDERITISIPAGPLHLAFEIYEDLREAQMDTYGPDTKEVIAISKRIVDRNQPNKQRPDEDDVITLSAAEWAFIRERAKRLQSIYADGYHERQRDAAAAAIIEVISRHLQ